MEAENKAAQKPKPRVEAVERALNLLEAFADGELRLTLSALSQKTGYYPSTVLRLFNSLHAWGYMQRDADGRFRLGPSLWRLGVLYHNAFDLERYVRPMLQRLADSTGETAAFYVLEGTHRICLYRNYANESFGHHVEEGARLPVDRGASAHVLMAFNGASGELYDQLRRDFVHVSHGERTRDAVAVAAPIFGHGGDFIGALNVTGPAHRMADSEIDESIRIVRQCAADLTRTLQGR